MKEEIRNLTYDLKVFGITLLTDEQVEKLSCEELKAPAYWWTRTTYFPDMGAVTSKGISTWVRFYDQVCAIRPALLIKPESAVLEEGEVFAYKDMEWKVGFLGGLVKNREVKGRK